MARGGNNSVSASLTLKRLVVSAPKEDWPKPPSFVGGGLGMKRCEGGAPEYLPQWQVDAHRGAEWFVFERSSSLEQLHVSGLSRHTVDWVSIDLYGRVLQGSLEQVW